MITIENSDGILWNIEYHVADMIKEYKDHGKLDIDLNNEGPCCEDIGLYNILDYLDLDSTKVTIHTVNQIEKHKKYQIIIKSNHFNKMVSDGLRNFKQSPTNFNTVKHFGCFIGRSNWVRLWLASSLPMEQTLMTFHYTRVDYHTNNIGLDNMLKFNATDADSQQALKLLARSPLTLEEEKTYPILVPANLSIATYYNQFFCEIVCETYFSGNTFFKTEKTLRPIALGIPFILHGPVGFLDNLKKLGYTTFDRWWSEEYDNYGHNLRIYKIQEIVREIASWSLDKLRKVNEEMQPILKHNRELLLNAK